MEAFYEYHWPGNVRELKHVIHPYVILPDVEMVLSELDAVDETARVSDFDDGRIDLGFETGELGRGKISLKPIAARAAEEAEKRVILRVLQETRWNRRRAAARLDICYKTLLNKLHHWQLDGSDGIVPTRRSAAAAARRAPSSRPLDLPLPPEVLATGFGRPAAAKLDREDS
jgi:DNA-binding NtrC family response regulator